MSVENRGRPSETPPIKQSKIIRTYYDVPSKPEIGGKSVWYFDDDKSTKGAWKVEHFKSPNEKNPPTIKPEKGKAYNKQPVVLVFKTSNRSNAKIKLKIFRNENIDYILGTPKLIGVPDTAIILEIGVGESFIKKYASTYNL
jgi:hypothetical protein